MRHLKISVLVLGLIIIFAVGTAMATPIKSYTPVLTGGSLIDFEGFSDGTLIDTQYPGVTFGQAPLGGRPQINVYPWLFGYGAASGDHVLTGSTEGGYPFPTVAGITSAFATLQSAVQIFLSDTAPLGDYTVTAFDAGHGVLESLTVLAAEILPPGYAGGIFPPPGTFPLPGIFVGFERLSADIASIQVGPSSAYPSDAFAVDDLRYGAIPLPSTLLLLGSGLTGLLAWRRRRQ